MTVRKKWITEQENVTGEAPESAERMFIMGNIVAGAIAAAVIISLIVYNVKHWGRQ